MDEGGNSGYRDHQSQSNLCSAGTQAVGCFSPKQKESGLYLLYVLQSFREAFKGTLFPYFLISLPYNPHYVHLPIQTS